MFFKLIKMLDKFIRQFLRLFLSMSLLPITVWYHQNKLLLNQFD